MDDAVRLGRGRDRALLRAAGSTVVSRLGSALAMVVILSLAARSLTEPELGVVAVLTSLTLLLGFSDFGLGNLMMTRLPAARARGDLAEQRSIVAVVLGSLTVFGIVIGGLGAASAVLLDWPRLLGVGADLDTQTRVAVVVFFVLGGLGVPGAVGSRVLASMQRSAEVQTWNLAASGVSLALTGVCAALSAPMWAYVAAIAGVLGVSALVQTLWVLYRAYPELRPDTVLVSWREAVAFLRSASLFAVLSLSTAASYAIDAVVVSAVLGAETAAVFALAARIFSLVGSTLSLAGLQMWSALSDALARHDLVWARSRYLRALVLSSSVTVAACLVLVLLGRTLARIWVGPSLVPPMSLLVALAVFTVYQTALVQASHLLSAAERVRVMAGAGVVAAVVNVVASIALTHRYGITGPVLGSLVSLVVVVTAPVAVLSYRLLRELGSEAAVPA